MTAHPSDQSDPTRPNETEEPSVPPVEAAPAEAGGAATDSVEEPPAAAEPATEAPATEAPTAEAPTADAPAAEAPAEEAPATEAPATEAPTADAPAEEAPAEEAPPAAPAEAEAPAKKKEKKKPQRPDPGAIVRRIGTTSQAALEYVQNPDPKLSRMARKHREALITEVPPVTAAALLGPEALCRHFIASAASGRYRDLFNLWELFKLFPEQCKPVLGARQKAQEKARVKLRTATHLGLLGDADRVAEDITVAAGLPWRWLKEILEPMGPAIRQRPAVLAAMLAKVPDSSFEIPEEPSDRWLAEAAALKDRSEAIPPVIDEALGTHADRLPASVATLTMAFEQYPDRVPALIDRVNLDADDIGAIMAWARDHGQAERLVTRIGQDVRDATRLDRATGLATWAKWRDRGVSIALPDVLTAPTIEGLDLGRPESAELVKILNDRGAGLDPQAILDQVAGTNRMLGEKAYESFVCAGFDDIHLPLALEGNPMVRQETRCPACQAWTWVRPGHEQRCPRLGDMAVTEMADAGAQVDAAVAALAGAQDAPAATPEQAAAGARPDAPPPPRPTAPPAAAPPEPPPAAATPEPPPAPEVAEDAPLPASDTQEQPTQPPAADPQPPTGDTS